MESLWGLVPTVKLSEDWYAEETLLKSLEIVHLWCAQNNVFDNI